MNFAIDPNNANPYLLKLFPRFPSDEAHCFFSNKQHRGSTAYTLIYLIPYLANNKFNTNFITVVFLKINSHQGEYMQAKVQKLDAQFKEDVPKVPDDV